MTKDDVDFETWFGVLQNQILDRTSVDFRDEDCVRGDYDEGRDVHDVVDEISAEYQDIGD